MKTQPPKLSIATPAAANSAKVGRRGLVVGAGVAGGAALAGHALLRGAALAPVGPAGIAATGDGDGYRLTPHILRYYETTKA
jgi:hypothetical protein